MADEVSLEEIKAIIELVRDAENVAEFSLKYGEVEVSLSRNSRATMPSVPPPATVVEARPPKAQAPVPAQASATQPAAAASSAPEPQAGEIAIRAPMVGTFYRAPKPGEPPFVEVGQAVRPDSVLCIIEVMKLMNSIQAGVEGTVARILVDDAQPVEYGQALIFIREGGR